MRYILGDGKPHGSIEIAVAIEKALPVEVLVRHYLRQAAKHGCSPKRSESAPIDKAAVQGSRYIVYANINIMRKKGLAYTKINKNGNKCVMYSATTKLLDELDKEANAGAVLT